MDTRIPFPPPESVVRAYSFLICNFTRMGISLKAFSSHPHGAIHIHFVELKVPYIDSRVQMNTMDEFR